MKKQRKSIFVLAIMVVFVATGLFLPGLIGAADAPVEKTGQTTSYATGDDGDLQKGVDWPDPRFTDNGDGTVTDNLTGLIWLQQAYYNSTSETTGTATWSDALTFCNALYSGICGLTDGSVAGDWRLPNVNELKSLINFGSTGPALPSGHPFSNVVNWRYWSSTSPNASDAWNVFLNNGNAVFSVNTENDSLVWPVRDGASNLDAPVEKTGQTTSYATGDDGDLQKGVAWPVPRFTDNGDGTVTDNLTGLIWLKQANYNSTIETTGTATWSDALTFCNALYSGICGLTDGSVAGDWRLPNLKELKSLINFGSIGPALPSGHPFTDVQNTNYWSSTSFNASNAWAMNLSSGWEAFTDNTNIAYVWPVRDGASDGGGGGGGCFITTSAR